MDLNLNRGRGESMAYPKFKVTFNVVDREAEDCDIPIDHKQAMTDVIKDLMCSYDFDITDIIVEPIN